MPAISSAPSPRTGKREKPVERASSIDLDDRVGVAQRDHPRARRHDVVGAPVAERDRALQQRRGVRRQRALLAPSGATSDVSSSGERADASSSWGSMPMRCSTALAEALKNAMTGPEHAREAAHEPLDELRGAQRQGDRQVLGHELAEDHRERRREDQRDGDGDAGHRARRHAEVLQRAVDELGDRRLGHEADEQVRQRDAQLGARQLRREAVQRVEDAPRAASPSSAARSTVERSTVTNENSAATNAPHASTSPSDTIRRSTSVTGRPSSRPFRPEVRGDCYLEARRGRRRASRGSHK